VQHRRAACRDRAAGESGTTTQAARTIPLGRDVRWHHRRDRYRRLPDQADVGSRPVPLSDADAERHLHAERDFHLQRDLHALGHLYTVESADRFQYADRDVYAVAHADFNQHTDRHLYTVEYADAVEYANVHADATYHLSDFRQAERERARSGVAARQRRQHD